VELAVDIDNLQKPSSLPFQMDIVEQALGIADGTGTDRTNHGASLTNQRFLQKYERMTSYLHSTHGASSKPMSRICKTRRLSLASRSLNTQCITLYQVDLL
jgi:hypothetical protein